MVSKYNSDGKNALKKIIIAGGSIFIPLFKDKFINFVINKNNYDFHTHVQIFPN